MVAEHQETIAQMLYLGIVAQAITTIAILVNQIVIAVVILILVLQITIIAVAIHSLARQAVVAVADFPVAAEREEAVAVVVADVINLHE